MNRIQDKNFIYTVFKPVVDCHTRRAFRKYRVRGKENIPTDGGLILGFNHSNALMDALVPLSSTHDRKVFIARADIFKKKSVAKILTWLKILPIYRIRDGYKSVKYDNDEVIKKAIDVVHDKVKLCLFPEAAHRTKHSLLKMSKGIFHIALSANKEFGNEMPIYIVPTGMEYGDYFRYRTTIMISFGRPINVTEYVKQAGDVGDAILMNGLRDLLHERLSELISYVPDDQDYDAIWELTKIKAGQHGSLPQRLQKNKQIIADILKLREKEPEKAQTLFQKVREVTELRKKAKLSTTSMSKKRPIAKVILRGLLLLLGLPLYLTAAIASLPIWLVSYFILVKLKDFTWRNTVNYGVEFVLHPLIMIVGIVLFFVFLPWYYALVAILLLHFSYSFFMDYREFARRWWSDVRWMFNSKLRKMVNELKF